MDEDPPADNVLQRSTLQPEVQHEIRLHPWYTEPIDDLFNRVRQRIQESRQLRLRIRATLRAEMARSAPPQCNDSDDFLARGITKHEFSESCSSANEDSNDVDDQEHNCPICYSPYGGKRTRHSEDAVRILRCGHVFGRKCLERHVETEYPNARLCPMCRGELWRTQTVVVPPYEEWLTQHRFHLASDPVMWQRAQQRFAESAEEWTRRAEAEEQAGRVHSESEEEVLESPMDTNPQDTHGEGENARLSSRSSSQVHQERMGEGFDDDITPNITIEHNHVSLATNIPVERAANARAARLANGTSSYEQNRRLRWLDFRVPTGPLHEYGRLPSQSRAPEDRAAHTGQTLERVVLDQNLADARRRFAANLREAAQTVNELAGSLRTA